MNGQSTDKIEALNETMVVLENGVEEEEIEMSACWVQCGCNIRM